MGQVLAEYACCESSESAARQSWLERRRQLARPGRVGGRAGVITRDRHRQAGAAFLRRRMTLRVIRRHWNEVVLTPNDAVGTSSYIRFQRRIKLEISRQFLNRAFFSPRP